MSMLLIFLQHKSEFLCFNQKICDPTTIIGTPTGRHASRMWAQLTAISTESDYFDIRRIFVWWCRLKPHLLERSAVNFCEHVAVAQRSSNCQQQQQQQQQQKKKIELIVPAKAALTNRGASTVLCTSKGSRAVPAVT